MEKQVLVYLGDQVAKKANVERVLTDLKLPYLLLDDNDLAQSVGYLFSLDGFQKRENVPLLHIPYDLLLFKGLKDKDILAINALLDALDSKINRKAMLTEHNKNWTLYELCLEIDKEHQYFALREQIQQLLISSKELIKENYTLSSWKTYEEAFYQAYETFQKESTLDRLQLAYQTLVNAKQKLIKH